MYQMEFGDLPMGFVSALAKNEAALMRFAELSPEQRTDIVNGTHSIESRQQMQEYVSRITTI